MDDRRLNSHRPSSIVHRPTNTMRTIDINCDMGESFGPWKMGDDEAIMSYITSANVACGAHAGDPDVMVATVRLAKKFGVSVGAHPGYPDLRGFGRRLLSMSRDEVVNMLLYQLGALWGIARADGVELRHVKPHGALYNRACEDRALADAVVEAVWRFSKSVALVGLPGSQVELSTRERGLEYLREGFADRGYEPNGTLRDRKHPDALISDPALAANQALQLAQGHVTCVDGTQLSLQVDTLCIHGDTPGASEIARRVKEALIEAHFEVVAPSSAHGSFAFEANNGS